MPIAEKQGEERLFVIREGDLRTLLTEAGGAASRVALEDNPEYVFDAERTGKAIEEFITHFQTHEFLEERTGHPELGRPMIPRVIVDSLAAEMFNLAMRQRWNQSRLDGDPPVWGDEVNGPNAEQADEWRSAARGHLMNIWDDLVTYFSTPGVLWWARLSSEECGVLLKAADCEANPEELEPILPKLRAAVEAGGTVHPKEQS